MTGEWCGNRTSTQYRFTLNWLQQPKSRDGQPNDECTGFPALRLDSTKTGERGTRRLQLIRHENTLGSKIYDPCVSFSCVTN